MNITDLINCATSSNNSFTWSNTTSAYSVSIVNSSNGKRISFSKSLCQKLEVNNEIYLLPYVDRGVIIISGVKFSDAAQPCRVTGTEKKTCYNAELVKKLSEYFKLDFTGITSKSFSDITVEMFDENSVATVKLTNVKEG